MIIDTVGCFNENTTLKSTKEATIFEPKNQFKVSNYVTSFWLNCFPYKINIISRMPARSLFKIIKMYSSKWIVVSETVSVWIVKILHFLKNPLGMI